MTVPSLQPSQFKILHNLHKDFDDRTFFTGLSVAAAAFLVIGALIIITCGCLCLMLPGINVMKDIILPTVIPGICALALSIPFIIRAVRLSQEKNTLRENILDKMVSLLDEYEVPEMSEKNGVRFVVHNLLDWHSNPNQPKKVKKNPHDGIEYQKELLNDLKEKMGIEESQRNPRQNRMVEVLEGAIIKIQKRAKK